MSIIDPRPALDDLYAKALAALTVEFGPITDSKQRREFNRKKRTIRREIYGSLFLRRGRLF